MPLVVSLLPLKGVFYLGPALSVHQNYTMSFPARNAFCNYYLKMRSEELRHVTVTMTDLSKLVIHRGDIAIFRFLKMAAAAILNF